MQQSRARIDIVFAVILFACITFVLQPPPKAIFEVTDLPEFYLGAKLFIEGRTSAIYETAQFFSLQKLVFPALGERAIPLYVAPFGLPFLLPLLIFPASIAYIATKVAMIAGFLLGLFMLCRLYQTGSRWFMWLGAILPFSGPVWEALRIEQVSPLLFLSLSAHLYFMEQKKPVLAAFCLSPFLLKPHLAATVCCFHLGARRFRFVLVFALIALSLLCFTYLYCGAQTYSDYFELLNYSMINMQWMAPEATPTLRGQLLRLPIDSQAVTKGCTLLFGLVLLGVVYGGHLLRQRDVAVTTAMVAVPAGLVLSLHCYSYDLVLLLPAVILAVHASLSGIRQKQFKLADLALYLPLLSFMLPFYALIHYILTLRGSIINYHFLALSLLTVYLIVNGCRRACQPDKS